MNRRTVLGLAAVVTVASAAWSAAVEPVDLGMVTRIRAEGFRNSKVMDTAWHLTEVIGPRLTGSPAHMKASEWTRDQLQSWGLANVHLEPVTVGRSWSLERASVHLVAPAQAPLPVVPNGWTPGTNGLVRAKAVRIAKLPESQAELEPHKGKLAGTVLFVGDERKIEPLEKALLERYSEKELQDIALYGIPGQRSPFGPRGDRGDIMRRMQFRKTLDQFLADEKVVAVVEGSMWDRGVVRTSRGGSREKGDTAGVPSLVMSAEHFNRIVRLLDHKFDVELEIDVKTAFHDDAQGFNTVGEIPGTDKKGEVVMAGAHLDSWHAGTGATDNAAGVAVVMEALRILKALDVKPKRAIRVALWTGEEEGFLGSRAYVSEHLASRPEPTDPQQRAMASFMRRDQGPLTIKPEHAKLSAYFNLDNGTGKIRGIYAQENAAVAPIFEAWLAPLKDLGVETVTMRTTGGTDHQPFDAVGLPGFQFIQDPVEYMDDKARGLTHHSNMDVYDRLQRDDLMQASVVMASFLYQAAMRDELIPRKPMPKETPRPQPPAGEPTSTRD
jgi:carboxypeptidase Q